MLATDDDLYLLIYDCWKLCIAMSPIPGNEEIPGKVTRFHATLAAESTIFWLPFVFVQIKTIFGFLLWLENYCNVSLGFLSIKIDKC